MIARVWHGYTNPEHADAYGSMPKPELLPGICYNHFDAFATVCWSRGGRLFRPDSSPPFLPAV